MLHLVPTCLWHAYLLVSRVKDFLCVKVLVACRLVTLQMVELFVSGGRNLIWIHARLHFELGRSDGKTIRFLTIHQRVTSSKAQLR